MNEDEKLLKTPEFYQKQTAEAIDKAVKKKRPGRSEMMKPQLEEGDNTKYLHHALRFFELPKCDMNNAQEVWERTVLYFKACEEDDMKPGIVGYANSLGISRQELHNIANGMRGNGESVDTIKKAKAIIEQQMESYMQNGKINPVSGIFLLKNNFTNYLDKQEIEVKAAPTIGEEQNPEEIAQKYLDALPGVVD